MTAAQLQDLKDAGFSIRRNPPNANALIHRERGFVDLFYGKIDKAIIYFHERIFPPPRPQKEVDSSHARKRCKQRFKFKMSKRQYRMVCDEVVSGRAIFIEDSHSGRSIWAVGCAGHLIPVVYDPNAKGVITVLPRKLASRICLTKLKTGSMISKSKEIDDGP